MIEDAFDNIRHQRGLRSVELTGRRTIGASRVRTVDAGIDQPDRGATRVDEIFPRRTADLVGLLPDEIRGRVVARLRTDERLALLQLADISLQTGGRDLRSGHVDRRGVIQLEKNRTQHQRGEQRAGEDGDLLILGRRPEEVTGLQVLRRRAALRGGDADDRPHRQRRHIVTTAGPAHQKKNEAREQQRRHGHPGNRIRRGTDFSGEARGHRHEEKTKHDHEDSTEEIHMQRRHPHDGRHQHHNADPHKLHRKIPVRAPHDGLRIARRATDPDVTQSALQALPNRRQRLQETDNPSRRDRAGTDVEDIRATNLVRPHLGDGHGTWRQRTGNVITKKFDQRNQQQVTQHSARTHN